MRAAFFLFTFALSAPASAEEAETQATQALPSAEEILRGVDEQLAYDTRAARMKMEVVSPRRTRTFEMRSWGRGLDEAAIEYLAPARERGTRMLRRGDQLWMYLPAIERVQRISGHMLRDGMMGSDVSYEDLMTNVNWQEQYTAEVTGRGEVDGRPCWTVEMQAVSPDITYPRRVTCVDVETSIPLRQELFALSGMLLKTWTMSDIRRVDDRWVPHLMRVEDALQEGTHTEIRTQEIEFGADVPTEVFTTRWLERGR